MSRLENSKTPKIIIAWPYSEDDVKFASALKKLGIIDDYEVSRAHYEMYLISYKDIVRITRSDEEKMFMMALGFVPEEFIRDSWLDSYIDVRRGKIKKYTEREVVIEASVD